MNSKMLKKIILVNLIVIVSVVLVLAMKNTQTPNNVSVVNTSKEDTVETKIEKDDEEDIKVTATQSNQTIGVNTTPTPTPVAVVPDNRCIVTVSGNRYDVTTYRNKHSGGDIFNCGTDMTSIFNSQHSTSFLKQVAKYLVK
jgi:cytochrome b involved in lipid metabolism